ncbi:MAG: pilus assembly protein PilP [Gammaproteobacteria bacterium]|jgi:type IV pilus assembly protein PilP
MSRRGLTAVLALLAIGGCESELRFHDLDAFMDEVEARPKGSILPLPEFEPYQPFAYSAGSLRSPFQPPIKITVPPPDQDTVPPPATDRPREFLEQFPVDSLKMVGTLARRDELFALVEDSDGGVHRVQPGDYMGQDYGQIQEITETEILLTEVVSNGVGGWIKRNRSVILRGEL